MTPLPAREADLDLVEVSPDSDPPVCRILRFRVPLRAVQEGKGQPRPFQDARNEGSATGPIVKIDPHDISIRLDQARRFLIDGHKVQIVQNFRGREMLHKERGNERMQHVMDTLDDVAKIETPSPHGGTTYDHDSGPDKTKIARIKQQEANASKAAEAPEPTGTPLVPEEIADATLRRSKNQRLIPAADTSQEDDKQDS